MKPVGDDFKAVCFVLAMVSLFFLIPACMSWAHLAGFW